VAVVAHSIEGLGAFGDNARVVVWSPMANGDTGQPFEMPGAADRTVHFSGTPGAGGTVIVQGSNHLAPGVADADWFPLTDPQGNAISKTAASTGEAILELTRWIRPKVTAGDGATAWQVRLLAKK
jgi:hypothetical protein